jgi:hypothetical protein
MNIIYSILCFLVITNAAFSQSHTDAEQSTYFNNKQGNLHNHKGFFISMSAGPSYGKITDNLNSTGVLLKGPGAELDLKTGTAIVKNILIHFTFLFKTLAHPVINSANSNAVLATDDITLGESVAALGLTYYISPSNFFLSCSAGLGSFSVISGKHYNTYTTDVGLSGQVKLGKEWWVADELGVGLALCYSFTQVKTQTEYNSEIINSNRYGVLLQLSFN